MGSESAKPVAAQGASAGPKAPPRAPEKAKEPTVYRVLQRTHLATISGVVTYHADQIIDDPHVIRLLKEEGVRLAPVA